MTVLGDVPPKLLKALAVIADTLHAEFARVPNIEHPDKSKESCVLSSLAVRDFLRAVGFVNAGVRPVAVVMRAFTGDTPLHSLGIGLPGTPRDDDRRWCGHLVAWVPGSRVLIDTTLYQAIRPQWPDCPRMLALACQDDEDKQPVPGFDLPMLTAISLTDSEQSGYAFEACYLDDRRNTSWRQGPDARNRDLRRPVIKAMRSKFGVWHGRDFADKQT